MNTPNPVTIYGLRNPAGEIVYVGQTTNTHTRQGEHRGAYPDCEFVELETCSLDSAKGRELFYIQKFAAIGQAQFNIVGRRFRRKLPLTVRFRVDSDMRMRLEEIADARFLRTSDIVREAVRLYIASETHKESAA